MMILGMMLALQVAAPATAPLGTGDVPQGGSDAPVIVVTARRLDDANRALKDCIERKCPPDAEMSVWLKKADAEYLMGDNVAVRKTLGDARDRNARYAARYPTMVSELWRAESRIASLQGRRVDSQIAARAAGEALVAGLGKDDPRVIMQRLEVADSYAMEGFTGRAIALYDRIGTDAAKAGNRELEARAMLRTAVVYAAIARRDGQIAGAAYRALDRVDALSTPDSASARAAAKIVRLKLDLARHPDRTLDEAMLAGVRLDARTPVLISAPQVEMNLPGTVGGTTTDDFVAPGDLTVVGSTSIFPPAYNLVGQWADISFRISPSGSVDEIEVIRQGRPNLIWLKPVREALLKRRYTPFADAGDPGVYRIERYSFVSDMTGPPATGSRIPQHNAKPHLEIVDLTNSKIGIRNEANMVSAR